MWATSKGRQAGWLLALGLLAVGLACGPTSAPTAGLPPATPQPTVGAESEAPPTEPSPALESAAVLYNLPQALLTEPTGLYASPNRAELVIPVEMPAGTTVYVMGRNANFSHLRVVWNTGVGWIPTSFTSYNAQREALDALPIFQREPPGCAVPITTQFNLNSQWTYEGSLLQQIAVVVDLFRSQYGDFPPSHLALKVNGQPVESSRRQIVERGQFSLKDVVFTLPGYMQIGDTLGYDLQTTSTEPLAFVATIFGVPDDCEWDTN